MPTLVYAIALLFLFVELSPAQIAQRPNVLVIITDDQGHGDLGFHGNPKIRTPHLDKFARESVQFLRFYVSPVCAPTRASLMTGRYNYRTGAIDTYLGRAMMHAGGGDTGGDSGGGRLPNRNIRKVAPGR